MVSNLSKRFSYDKENNKENKGNDNFIYKLIFNLKIIYFNKNF